MQAPGGGVVQPLRLFEIQVRQPAEQLPGLSFQKP
jgi:hypothetical protein